MFAVTQHGGHLGYFEGGLLMPNDLTWLDRVVVEYCNALLHISNSTRASVSIPQSIVTNGGSHHHHHHPAVESRAASRSSSQVVVNGSPDHRFGVSSLLEKPVFLNGGSPGCLHSNGVAIVSTSELAAVPL